MSLELMGWRREVRARVCRWTPLDGDGIGEILVEERRRPLVSLGSLLAARRARTPGPVRHVVTREGELAALVEVETADEYRILGVILGDDFQTVIEGHTADLAHRDRVRAAAEEIVVHLPLFLGAQRPRWYSYQPPAGWHGIARGLTTTWYAPDVPRNPSTIAVLPARPMDDRLGLDTFFRDESFADVPLENITRESFKTSAMIGTIARASSNTRAFVTAALEDTQFVYVVRLASTPDRIAADEHHLLELAESCRPLPSRRVAKPVDSLDYLVS